MKKCVTALSFDVEIFKRCAKFGTSNKLRTLHSCRIWRLLQASVVHLAAILADNLFVLVSVLGSRDVR